MPTPRRQAAPQPRPPEPPPPATPVLRPRPVDDSPLPTAEELWAEVYRLQDVLDREEAVDGYDRLLMLRLLYGEGNRLGVVPHEPMPGGDGKPLGLDGGRRKLAAFRAALERVCPRTSAPCDSDDTQNDPAPYIISHGGRRYTPPGARMVTVSAAEDDVLQLFLEWEAWDSGQLNERLDGDPVRTLRGLEARAEFAPAIDLPGVKSSGGYRVRVRPATTTKPQS